MVAVENLEEVKHPYLEKCLNELKPIYELCNRLEKRIALIKENYATKSEFEQNEIEITITKTIAELQAKRKHAAQRERYFRIFIRGFAIKLTESEKELPALLEKAKQMKERNKKVSDFLNSVDWKLVEKNDVEVRVKLYEELQKAMQK